MNIDSGIQSVPGAFWGVAATCLVGAILFVLSFSWALRRRGYLRV